MTFVALDDHGRPIRVPPVTPKSDVEKRRFEEADTRRDARISFKKIGKKGSQ